MLQSSLWSFGCRYDLLAWMSFRSWVFLFLWVRRILPLPHPAVPSEGKLLHSASRETWQPSTASLSTELRTPCMINTVAITLRNALSRDPSTLSSETDSHCTRYVKRSTMKSRALETVLLLFWFEVTQISSLWKKTFESDETLMITVQVGYHLVYAVLYASGSVHIRTGCVSWGWIRRHFYYFHFQPSFSSSLSCGSRKKLNLWIFKLCSWM